MASRASRFMSRKRIDSPFLDTQDVKAKELYFLQVLKTELISTGCVLAVPEPDYGDDLWVLPDGTDIPIRCQLKTAWSWRGKSQRSYVFNINEHNVRKASISYRYLYFFGMKHPEGPVGGFHVACLDGGFLDAALTSKRIRRIKRTKGAASPSTNRIRFNIIEVPASEKQRKTRWLLETSKQRRIDITDHVSTFRLLFTGQSGNDLMDFVSIT
ncbi:MAG: hypothetical protein IT464_10255 [Planctomycetes bacterium]|nr:hypothetical protein [Planctomycetota bacterium]